MEMNVRPLVISDNERAAAERIKAYAKEHVMSLHEIFRRMGPEERREELAVGNDPNFAVIIPFGYRCVYSQERQPFGLAAHLSVSVEDEAPTAMPNPVAVEEILKLFGMKPLAEAIHVGIEEIAGDNGEIECRAVNVITKEDE
jgi:hypothetical protein